MTAKVRIPAEDSSWNNRKKYGGNLTWVEVSCSEHSMEAWTVLMQATETGIGMEKRHCTICGLAEVKEIAKLPPTTSTQPTEPSQPSTPTQPTTQPATQPNEEQTVTTVPTEVQKPAATDPAPTQPTEPAGGEEKPATFLWIAVGIGAAVLIAAGVVALIRVRKKH